MAIDAKKMIKKIQGAETQRGRVSLYLNKALFEEFKASCDDVSASRVLEELMREFIESADVSASVKKKSKKKK